MAASDCEKRANKTALRERALTTYVELRVGLFSKGADGILFDHEHLSGLQSGVSWARLTRETGV
jgi:hypothetical protein